MQKWYFARFMNLIIYCLKWVVAYFELNRREYLSRSQKISELSRVLNSRLEKKKIDETVEAMFDVSKVSNEALTWPFSMHFLWPRRTLNFTFKILFHRSFFCWDSRICLSFFFFSSGWDCLWWQSRLYLCLNVFWQNWQDTGFWTQCMVS